MVKNSLNKRIFTLNCKGRLVWIDRPKVMGILNITPDSFYQGSRYTDLAEIETQAGDMINDGADFIDIGGQSTRPGSIRISADEEVKRIIPAIEHLHQKFPELIISVDTYQAEVAKKKLLMLERISLMTLVVAFLIRKSSMLQLKKKFHSSACI